MDPLAALGRIALFSCAVAWRAITPPLEVHETSRYLVRITVRCLLPVVATMTPLGMVMALQGLDLFDLFGAQRLLSPLITVAILRELAPVLASALVAAQGGSAFAAEIGTMRIRDEIDATRAMGIDPLRVHVAPRVVAATFATPILNLVGVLAGVFGGWLVAVGLEGEADGIYRAATWDMVTPSDLGGGLLKSVLFGAAIGVVATWNGWNATGGAAGVGRAVNDTVVTSVLVFVTANYFVSSALFGVIR